MAIDFARTKPTIKNWSKAAAHVSLASVAGYVIIAMVQHVLKPELDPSWRMLSEYALGDYGWLEKLGLLLLTTSCFALVVALRPHTRGIVGMVGLGLLVLSAAAFLIMSIFPTDPVTATKAEVTTHGAIHQLGAQLDVFPIAALLVVWSVWRKRDWSSARRLLALTTALVWLGQLAFVVSLAVLLPQHAGVLGPDVPLGWPQRFMIASQRLWLLALAWRVGRMGEERAASINGGSREPNIEKTVAVFQS